MSAGPGPHHEGELIVVRGTTAQAPGILWQRSKHALEQETWVDAEVVAADTARIVAVVDGEEVVYPSRPDLKAYAVEVPAFAKVSAESGLLSILLASGADSPEVLVVDIAGAG